MKRKVGEFSEAEARKAAAKKIEKKHSERMGLIAHAIPYVVINVVLWQLYFSSGGGFPWPLFVTAFWGIGMLGHFLDYHHKFGLGAQKREAEIDAEVARQARLAGYPPADEEDFDAQAESLPKRKRRLALGDDGELIDINEYDVSDNERQSAMTRDQ